jgi:SAM-dependent methyltransferase
MVGERAFDGAFSHFALTYVPSLERVASDLAALLKPGAIFLSSTRNRLCALDLMAHVLALRPGRARARLRSTGSFEVGGATVPIRNYALGELRRVFGPFFALEECRGLAVFLPPAEWAPLYGRARPVTGLLQTADAAMRDKWPFKLLGDHVLLRWKRLSHDVLGPSP